MLQNNLFIKKIEQEYYKEVIVTLRNMTLRLLASEKEKYVHMNDIIDYRWLSYVSYCQSS